MSAASIALTCIDPPIQPGISRDILAQMDTGAQIRNARAAAGMTQTDLASKVGIAQANLSAIESGRRLASAEMIERILAAARPRPSALLMANRDKVLELAAAHGAESVRVFGSIARNEDTPDSDIDLLLKLRPGTSLFDMADLMDELTELLGVKVDIVSEGGLKARDEHIRAEAVPV
jgi:predicted nucleotidyltransferase/DNA-binding XRE family transcriptional regulator